MSLAPSAPFVIVKNDDKAIKDVLSTIVSSDDPVIQTGIQFKVVGGGYDRPLNVELTPGARVTCVGYEHYVVPSATFGGTAHELQVQGSRVIPAPYKGSARRVGRPKSGTGGDSS